MQFCLCVFKKFIIIIIIIIINKFRKIKFGYCTSRKCFIADIYEWVSLPPGYVRNRKNYRKRNRKREYHITALMTK